MRKFRPLLLLALAPVLAACGGSTASEQAGPTLPSEIFSARPLGWTGPLVAYDVSSGVRKFSLPAGIAAADGNSYFAARANVRGTRLTSYNPSTGRALRSVDLDGRWKLAAVSPSGGWVALETAAAGVTKVAVVDWPEGWRRVLRLKGDFDVDTISADGASLFLIEHLGATQYVIRLYDLRRAVLVDGALTSKGSDKIMAGYAWGGTASPDGTWLLTLYLSTRRNVAFVHALNLTNSAPVCIDLPSGTGDFAKLKQYALTLAPDGQHVYAANPALGVVADVDLSRLAVTKTYRLPSTRVGGRPSAAVSGDGRTLYFASGRRLWALDSAFGVIRGPYESASEVVGLGFSRDDRLLYAAKEGGGVLVLEARNGEAIEA
jgi:hypothetical protein